MWGRNFEKAQQCVTDIGGDAVNAKPYKDLETACTGADVIVTVTMATEPIVKGAWLKEGTVILSEIFSFNDNKTPFLIRRWCMSP